MIASLAMYAAPAPVAEANARLWRYLSAAFRREGIRDVPDQLEADMAYHEPWLRPDLLLSQTCGYPFATNLRGRVKLLATPCYRYPGCDGPRGGSALVVRQDAPFDKVEALKGATVAVNSFDSNTGMNLMRVTVAPFAKGGKFFGKIVETGGHRASIAAVAQAEADVASIDVVTLGHFQRFAPEEVASVRVLALTVKTPGLPLITNAATSDATVKAMRAVLREAIQARELEDVRDILALEDVAFLSEDHYAAVLDLRSQAEALGYPMIA